MFIFFYFGTAVSLWIKYVSISRDGELSSKRSVTSQAELISEITQLKFQAFYGKNQYFNMARSLRIIFFINAAFFYYSGGQSTSTSYFWKKYIAENIEVKSIKIADNHFFLNFVFLLFICVVSPLNTLTMTFEIIFSKSTSSG